MLAFYKTSCPNCQGKIEDERLRERLLCFHCDPSLKRGFEVCFELEKKNSLKKLKKFCQLQKRFEAFREFFKKTLKAEPGNLQESWMKRILFKESFAIVAPTGIGKTTFGIITSLFLEGKSLIIVPTRILALQVYEKLKKFSENSGKEKKIFVYLAKKKDKEILKKGDFEILVGTNMFLHKNFETLSKFEFNFIFIDDIDSFLKNAKNVDYLFKLLGFKDWQIKLALKERKTQKELEILKKIREKERKSILVLSSATLKPKTKRALLFSSLLGFSIQKANVTLRNIIDVKKEFSSLDEIYNFLPKLIKFLGKGGIVYLSSKLGKEEIEKLKEFLEKEKLKVISYLDFKETQKLIEEMKKEDFDVALGLAHISNPLVRGIDLPEIIKYVIFVEVPEKVFSTKLTLNPSNLSSLSFLLFPLLTQEEKIKILETATFLRKYFHLKEDDLEKFPQVKAKALELKNFLEKKFASKDFLEKLKKREDVFLKEEKGELFLVVGDASVYLQGSGRTSRLVGPNLTKGISFLLYSDKKGFFSLKKRLKTFFFKEEIDFWELEKDFVLKKAFQSKPLKEIKKEIEENRKEVKEFLEKGFKGKPKIFKTTLVIVESPTKAKTISSFFGRPQKRILENLIVYEIPIEERLLLVSASLGHLFDLTIKDGFFGVIKKNEKFFPVYDSLKICPQKRIEHTERDYLLKKCGLNFKDKKDLVEAFQRLSYQVEEVFIATDPDTEGEKIAFDIFNHLKFFNPNIKRAEFHEVTPKAFLEALKNPREVNFNLVKAQFLRRILDRWVGFVLSRRLWRSFKKNYLSAGRVQTPVLGWVIKRFFESKKKKARLYFRVNDYPFYFDFEDLEKGKRFFEGLDELQIKILKKEIKKIPPLPPYRTDTILEDASRYFKLSAKMTMQILQELFERGFITYHRTDSTRVSDAGKYLAKNFIEEKFGKDYLFLRSFKDKEGAHECIRPTRSLTLEEFYQLITQKMVKFKTNPFLVAKLYGLIFKRFIASQMKPAEVEEAEVIFEVGKEKVSQKLVLKIIEPGFNLVFPLIKACKLEKEVKVEEKRFYLVPKEKPFSQGSLIEEMKRKGLGRPSTYALIIDHLLQRHYLKEFKNQLFPTRLGILVFNYLQKNFGEYVSEDLTRKLEEKMDKVEEGKEDYQKILKEFYQIKNLLS